MSILIVALLVLAVLSAIVGLWQTFTYISMSWARRNNSRNFTGLENASAVLNNLGSDIKVKSAFWNFTYVNYSRVTRTLKLGLFDSNRRSLWTMAQTGRQAFSAHILDRAAMGEKPPISTFWFRLQTFWFGLFMSMLFNTLIIASVSMWLTGASETGNIMNMWFIIFLSVLLIFPLLLSLAAFKTSKYMIENVDMLFGNILTPQEVEGIRKLWRLEYIQSIIDLMKIIIIIVFTLIKALGKAKNN